MRHYFNERIPNCMKQLFLISLLVHSYISSTAQMTTNSSLTVQQYVQDVLLGQNVSVSNITFNGSSANIISPAVGGFEAPNSNLGITSGFAMSSGDVAGMVGPNNNTGYTGTGTMTSFGSDPDLLSLVQANGGTSINDWVIIEFDFVPLGDTLSFNYVWGSEEYDTYVGSGFNDVFGFFISGPGITGPYSNNAQNIALVPGTNTNVAINSINNGNGNAGPCSNCEYYNQLGSDNDFFTDPNQDIYTDPFYMQYDGFTDVLTARAIVQCGLTYHIKLAVCDANDSSLDSGVFLQRDSFSSNLVVQVSLNLDVSGPDGNTLYENCGDGSITFERPASGDANVELVAYIEYSGTAIMGVDYVELPDSVVFPPGVMLVEIPLDAFADGIPEGAETVHMEVTNIAECGEALLNSSFDFFISDVAQPLVVEGVNHDICSGTTITLEPIITGGYAVYQYSWSTGESTETIDVSPSGSTTYFLTVSDTCGMPSDDAQFIVNVIQVPVLLVDIVDQDNVLPLDCEDFNASLYGIASGGIEPYTYTWTDDNGFGLWGFGNQVSISSWNSGMIYLELEDGCGYTALDSIEVTVNVPPLNLVMPPSVTALCGTSFQVQAQASGGFLPSWSPDYSYSWSLNGVPDWNQWSSLYSSVAAEPGIISVIVGDQCGQQIEGFTELIIESPPISVSLPDELTGNCVSVFTLTPVVSGGSGNFAYFWTEDGDFLGTSSTINFSSPVSTTVFFEVVDACFQNAVDSVLINIINPPITSVSLGDDLDASCVDNTLIDVDVQGGSGGFQYQWLVNGVQQSTGPSLTLQSFETVNVQVLVTDVCDEEGSDELIYNIPNIPLVITASSDTSICVSGSAQLFALADGGEGGFTYLWSNDIIFPEQEVEPNSTTTYSVVATDICGKTISEEVMVNVLPVDAQFEVNDLSADLYEFIASTEPECPLCTYIWDFGDGTTSNLPSVQHQFDGLGSYTISHTAINEIGCSDTEYYTVYSPTTIFIPNSFTPNGDGINDVFRVYGAAIREFEMVIFNRWGNVVFSSTDPSTVWVGDTYDNDSHYVQDAIYSYSIKVKGYQNDTIEKKGMITVIR